MPLVPLSLSRADEVEVQIDRSFHQVAVPEGSWSERVQSICRVAEDLHRYLLAEAAPKWMTEANLSDRSTFLIRVDRYKYAMRQALIRLSALNSRNTRGRAARLDEAGYRAWADFIMAAEDYAEVVRIFSVFRSGDPSLWIDSETGTFVETTGLRGAQYAALELLVHPTNNKLTPLAYLLAAFAGPATRISETEEAVWADWLRIAVDRTLARRGTLKLTYPRHGIRHLFEELQELPNELPEQWVFPWGSSEVCKRFFDAFAALLIYHSIATHFAATKHRLPTRAIHQFCLETDRRWLISELAAIANLSAQQVALLTDALTYGTGGIQNPDPALQPIIKLGAIDEVLVPPILCISSNWPRNLLSLHARVEPSSFDRQSSIFERRMVEELRSTVAKHQPHVWANANLPTREGREEVDLLVADKVSQTLLVCELRWMVQPGDVREVVQRQRVLREKVVQVERKCHRICASLRDVTRTLGVGDSSWRVVGLVVVEGFGGVESPKPREFPIVPKSIVSVAFDRMSDMKRLHAFFCTPLWLPHAGEDVELVSSEVSYFDVTFKRDGFRAGTTRYLDNLVQYVDEAGRMSDDALAGVSW